MLLKYEFLKRKGEVLIEPTGSPRLNLKNNPKNVLFNFLKLKSTQNLFFLILFYQKIALKRLLKKIKVAKSPKTCFLFELFQNETTQRVFFKWHLNRKIAPKQLFE